MIQTMKESVQMKMNSLMVTLWSIWAMKEKKLLSQEKYSHNLNQMREKEIFSSTK